MTIWSDSWVIRAAVCLTKNYFIKISPWYFNIMQSVQCTYTHTQIHLHHIIIKLISSLQQWQDRTTRKYFITVCVCALAKFPGGCTYTRFLGRYKLIFYRKGSVITLCFHTKMWNCCWWLDVSCTQRWRCVRHELAQHGVKFIDRLDNYLWNCRKYGGGESEKFIISNENFLGFS